MPGEDSDRERRRRRHSRDPESDAEYRRERRRESRDPYTSDSQQQRRRKGHRATDSQGDAIQPRSRDHSSRPSGYGSSSTPRTRRESRGGSSRPSAQLSTGSLAQLNTFNARQGYAPEDQDVDYLAEVRAKEKRLEKERRRAEREERRADKAQRSASRDVRHAEREERRRMSEMEASGAEMTDRERRREEERERRREEKRQARRAEKQQEKERQMQIELARAQEEAEAEERERRRYDEREKQRQLRKEQEAARRTRALPQDYSDYDSYADSPVQSPRKSRTRDRVRYDDDSYLDSPARSPRRSKKRGGAAYEDVRSEESSPPKKKWFGLFGKTQTANDTPKSKSRVISGPYLEDQHDEVYAYRKEKLGGSSQASDYTSTTIWKKKRNKRICIYVSVLVILLAIIIPVGVTLSKKNSGNGGGGGGGSSSGSSSPSNNNLDGLDPDSVPADKKGTIYDPWSWYDTDDFNATYTDETVGGLPIIGLNSTWDDDVQANSKVPKLSDEWKYGDMKIHGINVGGWLCIEPFITPSFFDKYTTREQVVDEWTLAAKLGPSKAPNTFEQHYSSFINKQTFIDIRAASFDHVRIPFGYWAVQTFPGDPFVAQISWRYLLRAIEYCRQNGLRVNLDLHGAPGSQNGWTHSGKVGTIGWLNGTDGQTNADRTTDIHNSLSQFFTQPRYKNVVTMYGLVNEPRMVYLDTQSVLSWSESAISVIRKNGFEGIIVFGDGFMGLDNWQGKLTTDDKLLLDVHQYVIFNNDQIKLAHSDKLNFACKGWMAQSVRSMNTQTGFGPTMCGEWSQADTDCAPYLNDVGVGSRWTGTLNTGNESNQVLSPQCPTNNSPVCSCDGANADPSNYSDAYKDWLLKFALAQMESFEYGWGWFYWTWKTEKATQWSYQLGMKNGILPQTVYDRSWTCDDAIPDYGAMNLPEYY